MIPSVFFSQRLEAAIAAATAAGDILRDGFCHQTIAFETKANRNDVVTAFDMRADRAIVDFLKLRFPADSILSEESGGSINSAQGQWVIDPLDGSNNFAQHVPHFATSIAFCEAGVPWVACIHDPMRGEMFTAIRSEGAHLNGHKLQSSNQCQLEGACLCIGTSIQSDLRLHMHKHMPPLLQAARALRTTGSAALDLAYIAAGRFDAVWYPELSWWDMAAGILLVDESGGRSTNARGGTLTSGVSSIVSSNGCLHDEMLHTLDKE